MSTSNPQESRVSYAASAIVIATAIGVGVFWYFLKVPEAEAKQARVSYPAFGPITVQSQGVGIRTSIAIQTRAGNSRWIAQNRSRLDGVFQETLAKADPQAMLVPNGLQNLQILLKDAGNAALDTNNVEAVLLTDFVLVRDDE